MKAVIDNKQGFTFIELLVSLGIMLTFFTFAGPLILNNQLLASYSKHKIQAAYTAQQLLETQRQNISAYFTPPLGPLSPGQVVTILTGAVALDTKGNYANTNCATNPSLFCGVATITITPTVYNNNGVLTTSSSVDHLVVTIQWNENILNKAKVAVSETYAEDLANDPMLN